MKKVQIVDDTTGEVLLEKDFSGGFHFIYTNHDDGGRLHHIRALDNAKFGDKHWIKNYIYRPIALKLREKFDELKHINPNRILFIEEMEWEDPKNGKYQWVARINTTNKQFCYMADYSYILETRNWYIERMSREQIIALIYHELRHIGKDGNLIKHDVEDWDNMVATLGKDWATTESRISNILEDDVIWEELEEATKQLNVFNLRAV